jgi:hypothetical protein
MRHASRSIMASAGDTLFAKLRVAPPLRVSEASHFPDGAAMGRPSLIQPLPTPALSECEVKPCRRKPCSRRDSAQRPRGKYSIQVIGHRLELGLSVLSPDSGCPLSSPRLTGDAGPVLQHSRASGPTVGHVSRCTTTLPHSEDPTKPAPVSERAPPWSVPLFRGGPLGRRLTREERAHTRTQGC